MLEISAEQVRLIAKDYEVGNAPDPARLIKLAQTHWRRVFLLGTLIGTPILYAITPDSTAAQNPSSCSLPPASANFEGTVVGENLFETRNAQRTPLLKGAQLALNLRTDTTPTGIHILVTNVKTGATLDDSKAEKVHIIGSPTNGNEKKGDSVTLKIGGVKLNGQGNAIYEDFIEQALNGADICIRTGKNALSGAKELISGILSRTLDSQASVTFDPAARKISPKSLGEMIDNQVNIEKLISFLAGAAAGVLGLGLIQWLRVTFLARSWLEISQGMAKLEQAEPETKPSVESGKKKRQ